MFALGDAIEQSLSDTMNFNLQIIRAYTFAGSQRLTFFGSVILIIPDKKHPFLYGEALEKPAQMIDVIKF